MKKLMLGFALSLTAFASDEWRAQMKELSAKLADITPSLFSTQESNEKLEQKIKAIFSITQKLGDKVTHADLVPDSDPALVYVAKGLNSEIERAYASIKEGHPEYARMVMRSTVSYCIACHTRTQSGPEFPLISAFDQGLKNATWEERIEFLAATREFEAAVKEVLAKLKHPGDLEPLAVERAARVVLAVAVRVKNDADKAMDVAQALAKSPGATLAAQAMAKAWQKDIKSWKSEKNKASKSDKDLVDSARKLIGSDQNQDAFTSEHFEVRYLRASQAMHELLRKFPKSDFVGEAFYIIGLSYESLRELGLWSLHEMYYLACIDKSPHSALAKKCFKRYEDSIVIGYSGSSGTHLPTAMKKKLGQLKEMVE